MVVIQNIDIGIYSILLYTETFEGEVRLVGGANDRQGRLEVFHKYYEFFIMHVFHLLI